MRNRTWTTLRSTACAAVLACTALAAPQTPGNASPAEVQATKARIEVAGLVNTMDALLEQVHAVQLAADAAMRRTDAVDLETRRANLETVAKVTNDLREQLGELGAALEQRAAVLRELRHTLAREVPPDLPDALAPLREHIADAAKLPSLADAEDALVQIESDLQEDAVKDSPGASQLLGLARYRLADTLRQRAVLKAKTKGGDREAEKILNRASRKFAEVTSTPDCTTTAEGDSLHAAALRRIVQIESSLYGGYRRLSAQNPKSNSYAKAAREHRQTAEEAFEKLQRIYPNATLATGRRAVDEARDDARELTGR